MPLNKLAPLVIAVDGPAAVGKGTLARRLAAHYGLRHLDTGLLYRATALRVLRAGGDPEVESAAAAAAGAITDADFDDPALRDQTVGDGASVVGTHPAVRRALLHHQRAFAARPPGAVLDGRDIGTVVCPDARVKFYLEATTEVRAARRLCELRSRGVESIDCHVLEEIIARDARDRRRSAAPMKPAADACRIDTSALGPDDVFEQAVAIVDSRLSSA